MKALFVACAMSLGLVAGAAPAHAADDAGDKLAKALLADVDASSVPQGYTALIVEPFAIGDGPAFKSVTGAVHALFERKNRSAGQPEFDTGYEGFAYFVFPTELDAQSLATNDAMKDYLAAWGGEIFKARAAQTLSNVTVKSPDGASLDWRCRAIDYVISCVRADKTVLTQVALQEPKLRDASSEGERKSVVQSRVQAEADGLFKTALAHLARARKAAGS